ncbi:MAG: twin-arginine translocase TatA/TatE family subunit, partial [Chloroflexota bacterium]|nr:twin-arginine translocase TatA/TatE family subunit [Chloroflexota bacterium]
VLIVFGPGKLPDIGNALGRAIREVRKASGDLEDAVRGQTYASPPPDEGPGTDSTTTAVEKGR